MHCHLMVNREADSLISYVTYMVIIVGQVHCHILTSLLKNVNTPVYFRHAGQPDTATVSVLGPHAIY